MKLVVQRLACLRTLGSPLIPLVQHPASFAFTIARPHRNRVSVFIEAFVPILSPYTSFVSARARHHFSHFRRVANRSDRLPLQPLQSSCATPAQAQGTPLSRRTFFGQKGDIMADTKSATSFTSGGKRKRATPLAFYAVKVGRTPGIYQTWDEANSQIQGFPNSVCKQRRSKEISLKSVLMSISDKKFSNYTEAEAMMKGLSGSSSSKTGKTKYYGVAVGHVPGVYTDYATVQAQTKGCVGAKQKSFATRADAQAYVNEYAQSISAPISLRGDLSETSSSATGRGCKISEAANKKQKKEHVANKATMHNGNVTHEPGMGPLPPDAEDGFDRTIKMDLDSGNIRYKSETELSATKIQPSKDFSGPIVVYTDGSSLGNGRVGAVAGVGVYFGPKDPRNVSEPLRGERQTNQRAELTAVARALDHVPIDREILIVTDSNYSIKCLTEWFIKWEQKGWKNSQGKPVENRDLIEPIIARIRERDICKAKTKFKWIKGHANDPGNVAADSLAVNGSRLSTPELRNAREISVTLNPEMRASQTPGAKQEPLHSADIDEGAEYDQLLQGLEVENSIDQHANAFSFQPHLSAETESQSAQFDTLGRMHEVILPDSDQGQAQR